MRRTLIRRYPERAHCLKVELRFMFIFHRRSLKKQQKTTKSEKVEKNWIFKDLYDHGTKMFLIINNEFRHQNFFDWLWKTSKNQVFLKMRELLNFCDLIEKMLSFRNFSVVCLTQYTKIDRRDELYKLAAKIRGQKAFFWELRLFLGSPGFGHSGVCNFFCF